MNELIKTEVYNDQVTVLARDLHHFLDSQERFSKWFERMNQSYNKVFKELEIMGLSKEYLQKHFKPLLDKCIESTVDATRIKKKRKERKSS